MNIENTPLIFNIGEGNTIVSPSITKEGVLKISITRNSSNLTFQNSHSLTQEEIISFKKQVSKIPDAVFYFKDIELGIKFYSGFFKNPNLRIIEYIRNSYESYLLAVCC